MNVHEYQAKALFRAFGIPVPEGVWISTEAEAGEWADRMDGRTCVVKAQIHAGGRGKAGGVRLVRSREELVGSVKSLLGTTLVTHQTGPQGRVVRSVLIEEGVEIEREFYLSLLIDRSIARPVFVASAAGGMEIEEVAASSPEQVIKLPIDPLLGFRDFYGRILAGRLEIPGSLTGDFVRLLGQVYRLFVQKGAMLIEINPLVLTRTGRLMALDAKAVFDDNALFRHEEIRAMRDLNEEEPLEVEASRYNLNYVKLDGEIGCMVNGAGLAMATMDSIKLAGGQPANFLDVGGTATKETVKHGFRILLSDPHVRGIFVNIFGGIVRCERIAGGIIDAADEVEIPVPVVIRLEGTNAEEGRRMLRERGLKFHVAKEFWEGAKRIVELTVKGEQ